MSTPSACHCSFKAIHPGDQVPRLLTSSVNPTLFQPHTVGTSPVMPGRAVYSAVFAPLTFGEGRVVSTPSSIPGAEAVTRSAMDRPVSDPAIS
ncbi:hypothetical protein BJQ90_01566 [Arthrobacter sp. SO3]|nr:hypothetical protein [Arthrobacter sp. SO3]